MRFESLTLEQFGHFRSVSARIDVPSDAGLVIVQGDNEAGKSTVLAAVKWLLFGGMPREYAIDVEVAQLAVSARIALRTGLTVDIRRSRGRGAGLRGHTQTGDDVDEEWISGRLSRPSLAVFQNVFGFSLEALASGADELAKEELKSAMYGGGLGSGVHPDAITEALRTESEKLFRTRGAAQIPSTLQRIRELRGRVAAATTLVDAYRRKQQELADKRRAAADAEAKRRALREQEDEARTRLAAIAPLRAIEGARAELASLDVPEQLSADAVAIHTRATERRRSLVEGEQKLRAAVAAAEQTLAEPAIDAQLLEAARDIDSLVRGLAAFERAVAERPARAAEIADLESDARATLADLRPDWHLARLRTAPLDAVARAELEDAIAEHERLARDEQALGEQLTQLREQLDEAAAQRASLGAAVDLSAVRAWIDSSSGDAARRTELGKIEQQLRKTERALVEARRKLTPPLPADASAAEVRTPRRDLLDELARQREAVVTRRERLLERDGALEKTIREHTTKLAELRAKDEVPTDDELRALRRARDTAWDDVSAAVLAADERAKTLLLPFERSLRTADDAVDRMRARSRVVEAIAQNEGARARALDEKGSIARELELTANELADLDAKHAALWAPLEPLSPAIMRAFVDDHARFLELDGDRATQLSARDEVQRALDDYYERGRKLLGRANATLVELTTEATRLLEAEERRAREQTALSARERDIQRSIVKIERRLGELRAAHEAWAVAWPAHVAPLELDPTLGVETVRRIVVGVGELRQRLLDREQPLLRELDRREREIADYAARAAHVLEALSVDSVDVASSVRALDERLAAARADERRRSAAAAALADAQQQLEHALVELASVDADLTRVRALAGVADDDAFSRVANRRERAEMLRQEIDSQQGALVRLRRGEPNTEWCMAILAEDETSLTRALEAIRAQLDAVDGDINRLQQEVGSAEKALQMFVGGAEAADARSDLELQRAALREDVERWAVLRVADELLTKAMNRFERDNQPELLSAASGYFAALTLGRYRAMRKAGNELVCDRADGRELTPKQLSTGTREQLYLAIRLAYIEAYCKRAEPLPIVLDDVLVNFDDRRAAATLETLAKFSSITQVLLFTCHKSTIALAEEASVAAAKLHVPARS